MTDVDDEHLAALRERIRQLADEFPSRTAAAEAAGLSKQQLHNVMTGRNRPSLLPMAQLAAARGRSLDWLVTGDRTPSVDYDPELLGAIVDTLARVYEEEGVKLPPVELGRLAAHEHRVITATTTNPDERRVAVRLAAERVRLALRTEEPARRKPGA